MRLRAVLAALAFWAAAPLHAQDAATPSAAVPGDVIRLMVWRVPEFSGDFAVADDGTILHPLLSEVRVAGVPPAQVRARLTEVLRRYESDPRFVFSVLHRVAIMGEVNQPGLYPLPGETTIPQAIAAGGGFTTTALASRVRVIRGGQTLMVDLRTPGAPGAEMRIRPGDRIEVPRQTNALRDYLVPFATVVAAVGAVAGLFQ